MAGMNSLRCLRELPWTSARLFRERVKFFLPVLAPFSVVATVVLFYCFYCGPNIPRVLA